MHNRKFTIPGSAALAALVALGALATSVSAAPAGEQSLTLRQDEPVKRPAIVNGTPVSITQVPWQVFLSSNIVGGVSRCGGTIVNSTTVVTAAHCVYTRSGVPIPAPDMTVSAGISDFRNPEPTRQDARVAAVRVHPGYVYDLGSGGVAPDDIAVLTLARQLDVRSGPAVRAIAPTSPGAYPPAGTTASISGYGLQAPGGTADGRLYALDTTVGDPLACGGDANAVVLCVSSQVGSACQGDSGGPLTIGGVFAGVASFVTVNGPTGECGTGSLNGYTNLAAPEILEFVNGNPNPPIAPRGGRDISARGVFQANGTVTCSPGSWTGAPAFAYAFVDTRNGQVLQSGPNATYAFTAGDVGRTVACNLSASNAGGTGISRTEASPAIAAAPAPPPAPRPQPRPQPRRPAAKPSLRVSVAASSTRVVAGRTVTYTVRVANRGRAAARRVVVCDAPGKGLTFGRLPKGARKSRGRACWSLGTLKASTTRTLRVTLRVAAATKPGLVANRVAVSSANAGRRSATARVRVVPAQQRSRTRPPGVTG